MALAQYLEDYIATNQPESVPTNGKVKPKPDTALPGGQTMIDLSK